MYRVFLKRLIDIVVALVGLAILSPVFLLVSIFLLLANRGNIFFVQKRPGKDEKMFKIIKFKTMNDRKDSEGNLLSDAERITKVGAFIRKTSLDEIPQLLNVVVGDMSIIGPRPLLMEYLRYYSVEQSLRHNVRPGITGWAQVNGRNAISWKEKFQLDVWYVKNISFSVDLKILLLTIKKVIVKEGISSNTSITMEKFNGN